MKKAVCIFTVTISVIITVLYLRIGGLFGNDSALSTVGLTHKPFFVLWGVSTYTALAVNIYQAYEKTKYKFYALLLFASLVGMILTLACDFDYSVYPQYLAHCIGSLMFSAVTGVNVFLLFLLRKQYIMSAVCGVILVADLILLLIFKETALIEVVPIFSGYALLLINNLKEGRIKIAA